MAQIQFKKKNLKVVGIMNGTSVDGIDYALISVDTQNWIPKFIDHKQRKIPIKIQKKIIAAAKNQLTTYDLSNLHFELGDLYGKQLKSLSQSWKWDALGLHGQTVHHHGGRATLQIGTPAYIKKNFPKIPVVSDFRTMDVALNGQGAPFAPFFQEYLRPNKAAIAFHNLGGISNLTYFHKKKCIAFDTGPANILMDAWIQQETLGKLNFDSKGLRASQGLYDPLSLQAFLKHPYFKKKFPKSTGREDFNLTFIKKWGGQGFKKLSLNEQMATLCELTARSIAAAYQGVAKTSPLPTKIYFYGGGIKNTHLMKRLQFNLPEIKIATTEELGWPPQAFEASLIAFLAAARIQEKIAHIHGVTGANSPSLLGQVL